MDDDFLFQLACECYEQDDPSDPALLTTFQREVRQMLLDDLRSFLVAYGRRIYNSQQAKIDRLMLEYEPDEMTPEQFQEWVDAQVVSEKQLEINFD